MWNWFNCYLSGRHEYGVWCEPGSIFLRCIHCGKRSPGWAIGAHADAPHAHHAHVTAGAAAPPPLRATSDRVRPFGRVAAG
jgi:hypothetical protein